MADLFDFVPAASFGLGALADLYTCAFENYFYTAVVTEGELARRIRAGALVLARSPVLRVNGALAGLSLLAVRGRFSSCRTFGLTVPFRGLGLASILAAELLAQARVAGADEMSLVVLAQNE